MWEGSGQQPRAPHHITYSYSQNRHSDHTWHCVQTAGHATIMHHMPAVCSKPAKKMRFIMYTDTGHSDQLAAAAGHTEPLTGHAQEHQGRQSRPKLVQDPTSHLPYTRPTNLQPYVATQSHMFHPTTCAPASKVVVSRVCIDVSAPV
jgi:hypothetical protein